MKFFMIAVLSLSFVGSAQAQTKNKKTTVNFEDQLIEGKRFGPDILLTSNKAGRAFKKLVRLRENFLPELRQTSQDVKSSKPTQRK